MNEPRDVTDRAERLAAHTMALVDIASESREEAAILAWLRTHAPAGDAFAVTDDEDACLVYLPAAPRPATPLVLLAGHVDTVPIAANAPGRREGSDIAGRGACDMKGALAVMLEVMDALATGDLVSDLDVGCVWFGREEVSTDESALRPLFERRPELREAALAVMMEPTDNALEVGCLGNLNARVTVTGTAAHSARPWHGDNAIHGAIAALASIADLPIRDVEIDGLTYREVVNVTTIEGGVAANVIPDRAVATVNLRYAPNHTPAEAEARIRELLGHHRADVEVLSNARPGPVTLRNPLVERLRAAGGLDVGPKQAWTPVAEFAEAGVDAVNCGPGDPRYAHTEDERVSVEALVRSFEVLGAFLSADAAPEG